ncbi:G-type lectin S-receptor-like serine/threonine-protein kinase LECRK3 [Salvia divinorum]|uniref:G-type lectin S-receptor-like serine/threonine-protein kinase LECRK3 n=1 Tax=Salvia divinorum TaxID=28513 RepID=A0ABD1GDV9_SALDI
MSILAILFLLLISTATEAQRRSSNITLGSSLTPTSNSYWPSPSGFYAFGFVPQHVNSYAIGIFLPDKTVIWTANRDSNPTVPDDVVSLLLSTDGRLILRRRQGLDNHLAEFDHPTNTLLPGQRLPPGEELFSSASETDYGRGIFRLKMQNDGNLVQYPINTPDTAPYAYYSSRTSGTGGNKVLLMLEGTVEIPIPPSPSSFLSSI